jgi:hypothetical protein
MHIIVGELSTLIDIELIDSANVSPGVVHQEFVQMVDCFNAKHPQDRSILLVFGEDGVPIDSLSPFVFLD